MKNNKFLTFIVVLMFVVGAKALNAFPKEVKIVSPKGEKNLTLLTNGDEGERLLVNYDIPLPKEYEGEEVIWYNPEGEETIYVDTTYLGEYKYTYKGKQSNKKGSKIFSVEEDITSIQDIRVTLKVEESYMLPDKVQAVLGDGEEVYREVVWYDVSGKGTTIVETHREGTQIFFGRVKGYKNPIMANIEVLKTINK
ncbi:hypothetical protein UT300018_19490 [Clostridium faecium]|uniref:Ig-like domain-containing protein n=1 Tax=Clostridium faecium TaxID=2762223 RepID=A0ABR8YVN3_9CLOT|nr:Ig-like domain-containing protein [Clostridium faecium]MBD8048314.1 Ig-like domain-containing protein [Clostridium faecium]MDU1350995.1 Ig-like domain-containing protein [Clostridium argentinense]